jgi:hypothetical protein
MTLKFFCLLKKNQITSLFHSTDDIATLKSKAIEPIWGGTKLTVKGFQTFQTIEESNDAKT